MSETISFEDLQKKLIQMRGGQVEQPQPESQIISESGTPVDPELIEPPFETQPTININPVYRQRQYHLGARKARRGTATAMESTDPEASLVDWSLTPEGQQSLVQMGVLGAGLVLDAVTAGRYRQMVAQGRIAELPEFVRKGARVVSALFQGGAAGAAGSVMSEQGFDEDHAFDMAKENALWEGGIIAVTELATRTLGASASRKFFSEAGQNLMDKLGVKLTIGQRSEGLVSQLAESVSSISFMFNPSTTRRIKKNQDLAEVYMKNYANGLAKRLEPQVMGKMLQESLRGSKVLFNGYFKSAYKHLWKATQKSHRYKTDVVTNRRLIKTNELTEAGTPLFKEFIERQPSRVLIKGGADVKPLKRLLNNVRKELGEPVTETESLHNWLRKLEEGPNMVSIQEAHTLRSFIGDFKPQPGSVQGRTMTRIKTIVSKNIKKGIDDAMLGQPDNVQRLFKTVEKQYGAGAEKFYSDLALDIGKVRPSAVYSVIVKNEAPDLIEDFVKIYGEKSPEMRAIGGHFFHDLIKGSEELVEASGKEIVNATNMRQVMRRLGDPVTTRLLPGGVKKEIDTMIEVLGGTNYRPQAHLFQFVFRAAQVRGATGLFLRVGTSATLLLTPEILAGMLKIPGATKLLVDGIKHPAASAHVGAGATRLIQRFNTAYEDAVDGLSPEQKRTIEYRLRQLEEMEMNAANEIPEVIN